MSKPMMKCGHAANATSHGSPVCAICAGLTLDAEIIVDTPDLTGRQARCGCGRLVSSSVDLAFFEYLGPGSGSAVKTRGPQQYDRFYCGCRGWD